ncbi:MAG: DUF2510 domain-containing protein [Cryobacterium sp.]|nr:DUF2510 domain-containing protein [Cryobacterium sp.]
MTTTPAGWYPDPDDATKSRWWDGARWTEDRAPLQAPPIPESYTVNAMELKAPEGTPWNTAWIWIIVVLPFLPSLLLLGVDWSRMFDFTSGSETEIMLRMYTNPAYLLSLVGGFAAYGLGVWFAYLDWRVLTRRGVPRPFHWAWNFITPVYAIGRSVIVRRRTGRGISPMWVSIVLVILSVVFATILSVMIVSEVVEQILLIPGLVSS